MAARKNTIISKEAREKISKSLKGRKRKPHTEETKRKMSNSQKERLAKYNPWIGKKHSLDTINKIRLAKKGIHKGANNPNWKGGLLENRTFYGHQKYLERRNKIIGSHTFGEWELLKKQFGYRCPICLRIEPEIKLTEDHIIPVSKGGSNYIENIQPLCLDCNKRKFTKIIKYSPEGEIIAL